MIRPFEESVAPTSSASTQRSERKAHARNVTRAARGATPLTAAPHHPVRLRRRGRQPKRDQAAKGVGPRICATDGAGTSVERTLPTAFTLR
ncbi:hypothetical protein DN051_36470 [Streptomyces cadmiisoli]|uniref:Uncharacterized protein n=1 Tax=Streptomyces cadmiisoli TaxID=2184053 RepID=A0A2Z4J915_9ACTN|nr:hypothetical protein DN051_36470 [Streptomyces cadmiisoli]